MDDTNENVYIEGDGESPTTGTTLFWCLQKIHLWGVLVLYNMAHGASENWVQSGE